MTFGVELKVALMLFVTGFTLACEKRSTNQSNVTSASVSKEKEVKASSYRQPSKINPPANIILGMSVEEILRFGPCPLSKVDADQNSSEHDEIYLKCDRLAPAIKYEKMLTLTSLLTGEIKEDRTYEMPTFVFKNNRLVIVDTFIGGYVEYHAAIFKSISDILGPPSQGVSEDDIRKFDARLIDGMSLGWKDGEQLVYANIVHRKLNELNKQEYRKRYGNNFERYIEMYQVSFVLADSEYVRSLSKHK